MDEQLPPVAPSPPPSPSFLQRRSSRRALLIGTVTIAAGGTAAAVVGVAAQSGDSGKKATIPGVPAGEASTPAAAASAFAPALASSAVVVSDARKRAAHLLRRAGFGGSAAEIDEFAKLDRATAVNRLVDFETVDNGNLDKLLAAANLTLRRTESGGGQVIQDMQRWWLLRMAYTARPLEERMTFIWHGLLTSQVSKVGPQRAYWLVVQNELFRKNALGKYDDLVQAVAKDPAMLTYLDTVDSTKEHANENFPRELMELFTMGVGNYTEADIRESARAFTGWRLSVPDLPKLPANATEAEKKKARDTLYATYNPEFRFQPRLHDEGPKTFLSQTGNWNGEDIIRIIMGQPATARFVTARLFGEFAYPGPEPAVIDRLVKTWDSSGHSTKEVVRAILMSDEFYSEKAYRAKVRGPIEVVAGAVRGLEMQTDYAMVGGGGGRGGNVFYAGMDQVLFEPPNVAGWPGGPTWLSSSTFFARVNVLDQMFFSRGRPVALPALKNATTADALVDDIAARLVDGDMAATSRAAITAHLNTIKDPAERAATAAYLVAGSPEFQLI